MKNEWIKFCLDMMATPANETSGARKIISNVVRTFTDISDDLVMKDAGYTQSKMSMLKRLYLVEESQLAVVPLWEKRNEATQVWQRLVHLSWSRHEV
jgi:hypothetical protein